MIPKIIHQTWKTSELPDKLQHWHDIVKELHPGWEIKLWTDDDNLTLVKEKFPHMLAMYNALEHNIMRADVVRYMYMLIYGGYYLDLDYELFTPFDREGYNTELLLPLSREQITDGKTVIGNCVFGSAPRQVFWKDVLGELAHNPPLEKISNKLDILQLTGPEFISKIYFNNPEKYKGTLVPREIFHPNSDLAMRKGYKETLIEQGSRGIHHCEGSWLSKKHPLHHLLSKINSKLRMLK